MCCACVSTNRKFMYAYLNDPRFIEDCVTRRLIAFHVPQDTAYTDIIRVDQTKGSDIDKIVLEVLEVEGFDILRKASESNRGPSGSSLCVSISLGYLRKSWRGSGTCNHSSAAAGSVIYAKRYGQSRFSQNMEHIFKVGDLKIEECSIFSSCTSLRLFLTLKYLFLYVNFWNDLGLTLFATKIYPSAIVFLNFLIFSFVHL